uniref:Triacylglycerol lipase n=1 Tax=Phascolarctos cinereus TaxID=38626 RepID=A0A6P5KFL5_PHACI|nr:pancreatic triacylglycerol lipase-like isoform X2 [Phascolarctos cinereus]
MLLIWTISLLLGTVAGNEVCYARVGCFTDEKPWGGTLQRPFKVLPWSPEDVNVRFLLYTNESPNNYEEILPDNLVSVTSSNFNKNRKTRFVVHGFTDSGEGDWETSICTNLLQVEEVNCICVDWQKGASTTYSQASQNVQVVGAEIAYFVDYLKTELGYSPSNVHIIGHSLGSHIGGEAGKRSNGLIGRITGLDPAEPCFQETPEEVRLDPSDALFVDVIHTDTAPIIPNLGFGMSQLVGHLDFFPNGGEEMPGCQKNILSEIVDQNGILEGIVNFVACNHQRSHEYYADSILSPDGFSGYPCASYEDFEANKCFPCPSGGCPQMGHYADRFAGKTTSEGQVFYLNTGDASNFARWRYGITVTLSGTKVTGTIVVSLFGSNGNSRQYDIYTGSLKPGATHTNEIDSDFNVGPLEKVKFLWDNNVINLTQPKLGASTITVETSDGETIITVTYLSSLS